MLRDYDARRFVEMRNDLMRNCNVAHDRSESIMVTSVFKSLQSLFEIFEKQNAELTRKLDCKK